MILRGNVFSKTLEMDMGLTIVAPTGWKEDSEYSVVYLLHGLCGNQDTWVDYSMLPVYAASGNTLYILPDAARSFYSNMRQGFPYFTYITEELPEICKSVFRISADRKRTAVIGSSMGGYGALKCALSRPDLYGMCGAFSSPCLFLKEGMEHQRLHGHEPEFVAAYGPRLIEDFLLAFGADLVWHPENEVLELAKGIKDMDMRPRLYMACGAEDALRGDNLRLAGELEKLDFKLHYEEWPGNHDFIFFDQALKKTLDHFNL